MSAWLIIHSAFFPSPRLKSAHAFPVSTHFRGDSAVLPRHRVRTSHAGAQQDELGRRLRAQEQEEHAARGDRGRRGRRAVHKNSALCVYIYIYICISLSISLSLYIYIYIYICVYMKPPKKLSSHLWQASWPPSARVRASRPCRQPRPRPASSS